MTRGACRLRLLLLGPPIIELEDRPVKLETKKATALLAYLALRPRGLRRDILAALFWPEYSQASAFGNLRRTLASLNKSLPGGWLEADRETISLNGEVEIFSDVDSFEAGLRRTRSHCGADRRPCPECVKTLAESADLYRGDFLEGLNLPDCPEFDGWQLTRRESLRAELGRALERLAQGYCASDEWDLAAAHARRWVALDRLHEPAQRTLIEVFVRTGQRSAAIQQYESFAKLLDDELGTHPEAATLELYNAAIAGHAGPEASPPFPSRPYFAAAAQAAQPRSEPLLRAKIVVPPVRAGAVQRAGLMARLEQDVQKELVLVSAPAGFGKTTFLASWATEAKQPVAWVSLDLRDNDPRMLLRAVTAALRKVVPGIGGPALEMLSSPHFVPHQAVTNSLLNDLAGIAPQTVLVLDDYHVLTEPTAQEVFASVLDSPVPALHLVIATRADPRLHLARLRARGELAEFRAEDLRFSTEEAAEFLRQGHGLEITAEQAATLGERTEGWIVGLQMAALSMQGRRDVAGFVEGFSGSHRYILDYLADEVLNRQAPDVQSFLCRTSILRRLCGPLCDAVTGRRGDSAEVLEYLQRSNLFLVPLDDTRTWYRYHHLFADLLLARLTHGEPNLLPVLHVRASEWLEDNGLVDEAIEHARVAKDHGRVIRLIEGNIPRVAGGRQTRLPDWIGSLPRELLEDKPLLYLLQASGLVARGDVHRAAPLLDEAEKRIDLEDTSSQARDLHGQIAGLRAHFASLRGDVGSTIELTSLALQTLASTSQTARVTTSYVLARAYFTIGDFGEAKRVLSDLVQGGTAPDSPVVFVYALCVSLWGTMLAIEGRLNEALPLYRDAIGLIEERGAERFFLGGQPFAALASVLRERNELTEAERRVDQGIRLDRQWGNSSAAAFGLATRARVLAARGKFDSALEVLREASASIGGRDTYPDVRSTLNAALVQLHLDTGDSQAAFRVAHMNRFASPETLAPWREKDQITYARALIAIGRIGEALTLLEGLGRAAAGASRNARLIAILNLEALAQRTRGRTNAAVAALRKSLGLAAPEAFIRTFVDEGAAMRNLLAEAKPRLRADLRPYVDRLIGGFAQPRETCGLTA